MESTSECLREIALLQRSVDERTVNLQLEIDRINQHIRDEQTARLQPEIDRINQHVHEWLEERHRIVPLLVTLRSDVTSVVNREVLLADDFYVQRLKTEGSLEQISSALATITAADREQPKTVERLDRLEAEQQRFFVEAMSSLGTAVEKAASSNPEIAQMLTALEAQRADSAARMDALTARFSDQAQDTLFRALLPLAEVKADFEVLRTRLKESMASEGRIGARVEALEQQAAVVDSIAALQTEQAANFREIEWRSRLYLRQTNGGLFALKRGELISDFVASGQIWDAHVLNVAHEISAWKRGTAVDVGAHFGFMTAGLARLFDRVISFEPNDFSYSVLKANIALNDLTNVECHHTALYSRECDISLGRPDQQEISLPIGSDGAFDGTAATNLGALLFTENGSGIFRQRARTLDSYQLENVTFLKLDAQGAEGEILFGCIETLRRCHPVVVFEREELLSRNFKRTSDDVLGVLVELGYSIDLLHRTNEKQADYIAR